jgi:alkanesulfonate monooxygenase SsuD/methylene tetrahydromethanopterin reductase-like flavin-dependent oxidoreductase (luciferase family)
MQAAIFSLVPYAGPTDAGSWPIPAQTYSPEAAEGSMQFSLEQFELADQHFAPMSLTPNPMILAGALTQRVRNAKIALLGADIPILNPVRVAEEFAMLDTMTGGRIIAGMLRGTSNEYVTYAINPAESRERFEEAMDLIVHAWTEPQPFGWQGRYYEFRTISIWPRPVQQPHPPIYMSGSSPEAGEFAARKRLRLGFAFTTVPIAKEGVRHFREHAHAAGWDPTPEHVLYRLQVHVADTDDQAMEDVMGSAAAAPRHSFALSNRALDEAVTSSGFYGRDTATQRGRLRLRAVDERIELGQLLVGGPDRVLSQIKWIKDELGAGVLDLGFSPVGRDKMLHAIELFGTKVVPRMHEL